MVRQSPRRSLTDVRTHTTRRSSPALAKHELYMKLTSLEIERSRRLADRNATLERMKVIDQRLDAILQEQQRIMVLLDQPMESVPAPTVPTKRSSGQRMNLKY